MKKAMLVAVAALSLLTMNAKAESVLLDSAKLNECGGWAELKESLNGDLSVAITNTACSSLKFFDYSSKRVIKSYSLLNGQTFTLSKDQRESLSDDCRLGIQVSGRVYDAIFGGYTLAQDQLTIEVPSCLKAKKKKSTRTAKYGYYYEWSNKGNCKLMHNGEFIKLVSEYYCY